LAHLGEQPRSAGAGSFADVATGTGVFLLFFALLVLVTGLWSRLLGATRWRGTNLQRSLRRFTQDDVRGADRDPGMVSRSGLFALGVGRGRRAHASGRSLHWRFELPAILLVAVMPAMLAWVGLLVVAGTPPTRACALATSRACSSSSRRTLPVHATPGFWSYLHRQPCGGFRCVVPRSCRCWSFFWREIW
jgi:hypothetical protein